MTIDTRYNGHLDLMLKRRARVYRGFVLKWFPYTVFLLIAVMLYLARGIIVNTVHESVRSYVFFVDKGLSLVGYTIWKNGSSVPNFVLSGSRRLEKKDISKIISSISSCCSDPLVQLHHQISLSPLVKSVSVVRNIASNTITIILQEHDFIGLVYGSDNASLVAISINGDVIDVSSVVDANAIFSDLIDVQNVFNYSKFVLLYSYLKHRKIQDSVKTATMISDRRWDLRLKNGLLIKLPAVDWHKAIDVMLLLNKKIGILEPYNRLLYVDLRAKDKIFLR